MTAFERALVIDPGDARLRCETGYAAYRAGNVELADVYIAEAQRSLPPASACPPTMRVPVAMCLYNAGLVHEARGRSAEAARAYADSIALRPNATVQQHLDALGATDQPVWVAYAFDAADDAAIDARLLRIECDAQGQDEAHCAPGHHELDDDTYDLTPQAGDPPGNAPDSAPFAARVVWFARRSDNEGNQGVNSNHGWLVVRDGTQSLAALVVATDATGVWDCDAEITRFEWSDVIPGGPLELVLEETSCGGEMSMCYEAAVDTRTLVVCAADPMRCMEVELKSETLSTTYDECDRGEAGGPHTDAHDGYRLDYELGAGNLTLRPSFGSAPNPAIIGTHPISELLVRDDLRWAPRPLP